MSDFLFDATQHKPATGAAEPLPVGTYPVQITAAEKKDTKQGDGWYVKVEMTVVDGEHKGRKLWEQYNLANPNPDTVRIANEQFSALCHVIDVLQPRALSEIQNRPFMVRVGIKDDKEYGPKNIIKQYLKIDGSKIGAVAGTIAPRPAAPAAPVAPWAQKKAG